ncbi:FRG domain-containing protein [Microbacterium sp. ISL-59]|uniref:FRG domain-containing protein n=1 Tax=Microbacterium sp. ISL-59 TaxID=2819159 RepID=UPI001BE5D140|nr:FRG domain-containing protein [Microbacterium sp. ISL-59]MBT2495220.1 FRG domain-containing protein [Microbacterium sp. ISL-59]
MTDSVPQIQELLGRNLSAEAILSAGTRIQANPRAADLRNALYLDVGESAPANVRVALAGELRRALESMTLDVNHLAWILGLSELSPDDAVEIASALSALRLEVYGEAPVPLRANSGSWVTVAGPDILIDLLIQPLAVFSSFVRGIFDTWQHAVDLGLNTYWQNRLPDDVLTVIELFVLREWGLPLMPFGADALKAVGASKSDVPSTLDLEPVADVEDLPWEKNPEPTLNPMAFVTLPARERGAHVDPFYGHVFSNDFWRDNKAPYRPRRTVPAPHGVLSVPFREIPRYRATSAREVLALSTLIARDLEKGSPPGTTVLFRGQTREYTLARNTETLERLYGRSDVIEPSLLPSASRRTPSASTRMAFGSLVELMNAPQTPDLRATWSSFLGDQRKVAFAQHYGLATNALDLTDHLGIALWFALTRLGAASGSDFTTTPVDPDNESVIYILRSGEFDSRAIDVVRSRTSRPARQRGWVSAGSWGWQSNRTAKHIAAAVYFPGAIRKDLPLPATTDLFSPPDAEPLTLHAETLRTRAPQNPISGEMAHDLYSVVL